VRTKTETLYYEDPAMLKPDQRAWLTPENVYMMCFRPLVATAFTANAKKWHERLAHVNPQYVMDTVKKGAVWGIPVEQLNGEFHCESCETGKAKRKPFTARKESRDTFPGEMVHADLAGKMPVPSLGGANYFLLLKDDGTGFRMVYFLKYKDQTADCIQEYVNFMQTQTGKPL